MRILRGIRPSPAVVIASLALLVALAGTGYAASSLPANSVGTAQLKNNAVTSPKVKDHSLKSVDFAVGALPRGPRGSVGPPGPPGAAGTPGARGPTGPAGTSSASAWAVVDASGNLARGSNVVSVGHISAGNYTVKFNKNISNCTWPASLRSSFGFIETEIFGSTSDTVLVRTRDTVGTTDTDRAFHLVVVC